MVSRTIRRRPLSSSLDPGHGHQWCLTEERHITENFRSTRVACAVVVRSHSVCGAADAPIDAEAGPCQESRVSPETTASKSSADECSSFASSSPRRHGRQHRTHSGARIDSAAVHLRRQYRKVHGLSRPFAVCRSVPATTRSGSQEWTTGGRRRCLDRVVPNIALSCSFRCPESIAVALSTPLRPAATRRFPAEMHAPMSLA
jgi:hypothetical protein